MKNFCTPLSRIFSGDPTALLGQQSSYGILSSTIVEALSTPFSFTLDSQQAPDSSYWNLAYLHSLMFASTQEINNLSGNQVHAYLCPPSMFGSQAQDESGTVGGLNLNNIGIELRKTGNDLLNQTAGTDGGMQLFFFNEGPVIVPPKWFIRLVIIDDGSGANVLFPGTTVQMRALQQIIPTNFPTLD